MSEFTQVRQFLNEPVISIYQSGQGNLSAEAVEKWFDEVEEVEIYTDGDDQVGLAPATDGTHRLADGDQVCLMATLNDLGVAYEGLEDPVVLPVEYDPDEGLVVFDVSGVREAVADE